MNEVISGAFLELAEKLVDRDVDTVRQTVAEIGVVIAESPSAANKEVVLNSSLDVGAPLVFDMSWKFVLDGSGRVESESDVTSRMKLSSRNGCGESNRFNDLQDRSLGKYVNSS